MTTRAETGSDSDARGARAAARGRRTTEPAEASPRVARLVAEAGWIVGAVAVIALAAILATYDRADPGFSHAATGATVHNIGGRVGAWLADVLLLVFGFSAWLLVAAGCAWVVRGFRRLHAPYANQGLPDWLQAIGLVALMIGATGVEHLRLHTVSRWLPDDRGGVLGRYVGELLASGLGFTGATVALLVAALIGASLFFDFSWLSVAERVGGFFERLVERVRAAREAKQDRAIGEVAARSREAALAQ